MYSNLSPEGLCNRIILSDASDHFGILTKIPEVGSYNEKSKIYYRRSKLSSDEWKQFNLELKQYLNQTCGKQLTNLDPNFLANCITNGYLLLIEKYMPIKSLSRKQKRFFNKPWITNGLKISIKTKNKMFKLTKKSN